MWLPPHSLTRDWLRTSKDDDGEFFNYNDEDEFGEMEDTVYILVGCFSPKNTFSLFCFARIQKRK